jgi:hypothetical protein
MEQPALKYLFPGLLTTQPPHRLHSTGVSQNMNARKWQKNIPSASAVAAAALEIEISFGNICE